MGLNFGQGGLFTEERDFKQKKSWACSGYNFKAVDTTTETTYQDGTCSIPEASPADLFVADVTGIEDGASILTVVVWGTDAADTWELRRVQRIGSIPEQVIASGKVNVIDTSMFTGRNIVDTTSFVYYIHTSSIAAEHGIMGAKIEFVI